MPATIPDWAQDAAPATPADGGAPDWAQDAAPATPADGGAPDWAQDAVPDWARKPTREQIAAEIEAKSSPTGPAWLYNGLAAANDYLVEPTADLPRTAFNAPGQVINAVAGKPVVRTLQRGESIVPEILPSDVNELARWTPPPSQYVATPKPLGQTGAGLLKGAEDLARGFATPEVLATLPAKLPATAAAFAAQMIQGTPEAYAEWGRAFEEGTRAENIRAGLNALGSSFFVTAIAAPHVLGSGVGRREPPGKSPAEDFTKPQTEPPENDIFAEPLPEAPKAAYTPEEVGPPEPAPPVEPAPAPAQGAAPPTVAPLVETTAARFAQEQLEASRGMARMRQADEIAEAVDQVRAEITQRRKDAKTPEGTAKPAVSGAGESAIRNPQSAIPITERHIEEAREILAGQMERAPDILDDLEGHVSTGGKVRFGKDFEGTIAKAQESVAQALYNAPFAKLKPAQRKKVNQALPISANEGTPSDLALEGVRGNPRYADWTVDDLAQAMTRAAVGRITKAAPKPADVRALAVELARAEEGGEGGGGLAEGGAHVAFDLQQLRTIPDTRKTLLRYLGPLSGILKSGTLEQHFPEILRRNAFIVVDKAKGAISKPRSRYDRGSHSTSEGIAVDVTNLEAAQNAIVHEVTHQLQDALGIPQGKHWRDPGYFNSEAEKAAYGAEADFESGKDPFAWAVKLKAPGVAAEGRSELSSESQPLSQSQSSVRFNPQPQLPKAESAIPPESALAVKPAVDPIDAGLTRAIDALRTEPGATYADPLFIQTLGRPALRGALQVVRASYRAGKQLAEAIGEGIKWLRAQGKEFDESEARAWLEANVMPSRPGEGQNTHRFVAQLEANADLTPELKQQITDRVYDVRRQQDAAAAAQLILTEHGPDRAAQLFLDTTFALPGDARSNLAQAVILHWSEVERGMMMDPARRAEAEAVRSKNADFANAVMGQQTDSGQAISAWKGFWQQTPEGMVLAARRQIEGAGNAMVNRWTDLTQQVRQRLETTHDAAVTDTVNAPDIQRVAAEALDHAVATDAAVGRAVRTEAHEMLVADPVVRINASNLAGADMTDVLNIVLDHFRFTGKDPRPLPEKLKAAGVPENYARGFASSLEATWKKKVADLEAALPKRIRNARLSAEVLSLAESIVRGLETQADAARVRLREKFARMSAGVDPTIIADLSIIGAAHLGRATLDFAQWSGKMLAEFGDKVKPFLDEAWLASKQKLAEEGAKQRKARPAREPETKSDAALDKLIRAKLREKQLTLAQALKAVREDQLGQELGHAIIEQSGLKGPAAERLRDAINRRFKALATARKEAELRKILKAQSEGRSAPAGLQRSWKEVVEWSNQGVLTDARWQEAIRARLGAKRLSPEELQRLDRLARELAAIPTGEETRRLTASNKLHGEVGRLRANWWDLPLSVWFSNALSGIQTQEINLYANLANFTVEAAILGRRAPLLSSAALIRSLPEAGRDALLALTRGQTPAYRVGKIAAGSRLENLRGWENLALPLRYVFRALKGADLLFFVPAAEMKQAVAAKIIARQKGLRGESLARDVWETLYGKPGAFAAGIEQARAEGYTGLNRRHRAWEINLQKRSEALREAGSQFALDTTFNNSPYGFWGGLSDTVRAYARNPANGIPGKLSQLVAPFTPIISNVMNQGLNLSPWGYARALKAGWRMHNGKEAQLFGHEATREDIADEMVRATLGTLAMSAALLAFGTDDEKPWDQRVTVHGLGPRDKGRRDALRAAGWIPNSLQIGKKFYALEPYPNALPLAIAGNWLDAHRYQEIDQKSAMERLAYSLYQTRDTILNRSFLSGLAQLLAVKDTPTRTDRQMTDALARMGANFAVPNFFRALDRWQDPKVYDEPGIRGALMAQVPWLRRAGRPVLNDLGEPITRPLDKRWGSEVAPDPVWTFMAQHNLSAHASPDQDIGPFKMTEEQVYDFTRRRGQILRQMLEEKTKAGPPLYVMLGRVFDGNAKMTAALTQRFPALDPDKLDLAGRAWSEVKAEAGKRARKGMGLPTPPLP